LTPDSSSQGQIGRIHRVYGEPFKSRARLHGGVGRQRSRLRVSRWRAVPNRSILRDMDVESALDTDIPAAAACSIVMSLMTARRASPPWQTRSHGSITRGIRTRGSLSLAETAHPPPSPSLRCAETTRSLCVATPASASRISARQSLPSIPGKSRPTISS
jgi:hypothetical protein